MQRCNTQHQQCLRQVGVVACGFKSGGSTQAQSAAIDHIASGGRGARSGIEQLGALQQCAGQAFEQNHGLCLRCPRGDELALPLFSGGACGQGARALWRWCSGQVGAQDLK